MWNRAMVGMKALVPPASGTVFFRGGSYFGVPSNHFALFMIPTFKGQFAGCRADAVQGASARGLDVVPAPRFWQTLSEVSARARQHSTTSLRREPSPLPWSLQQVANRSLTVVSERVRRHRDPALDRVVESSKRLRVAERIAGILRQQEGEHMTLRELGRHRRRIGINGARRCVALLRRFPALFEVHDEGGGLIWFTFTPRARDHHEREVQLRRELESLAATKVAKFLMMARDQRLTVESLNHIRRELGLPEDFKTGMVHRYPHLFRLVSSEKGPALELVEWDSKLAVSVMQLKQRQRDAHGGYRRNAAHPAWAAGVRLGLARPEEEVEEEEGEEEHESEEEEMGEDEDEEGNESDVLEERSGEGHGEGIGWSREEAELFSGLGGAWGGATPVGREENEAWDPSEPRSAWQQGSGMGRSERGGAREGEEQGVGSDGEEDGELLAELAIARGASKVDANPLLWRRDGGVGGLGRGEGARSRSKRRPWVGLPPGLRLPGKAMRKLQEFHELPFVSPYDRAAADAAAPGTVEAEKRWVAVVHEMLALTVEKRLLVDHLTHFRRDFRLSQRLHSLLIRHPEYFYVSAKGVRNSVFLREAYSGDTLVEKDELALAHEELRLLSVSRERDPPLPASTWRPNRRTPGVEGERKEAVRGGVEAEAAGSQPGTRLDTLLESGSELDDDPQGGSTAHRGESPREGPYARRRRPPLPALERW